MPNEHNAIVWAGEQRGMDIVLLTAIELLCAALMRQSSSTGKRRRVWEVKIEEREGKVPSTLSADYRFGSSDAAAFRKSCGV